MTLVRLVWPFVAIATAKKSAYSEVIGMAETEEQKNCLNCHRQVGGWLVPYVGFYSDPKAKGDGFVGAD